MGCSGSKKAAPTAAEAPAEVQKLNEETKIADTSPAFDFELTLEKKPDEIVGLIFLDLAQFADSTRLKVCSLKGEGLVSTYNKTDANDKVSMDDIIVSVNGVNGDRAKMMEQIEKPCDKIVLQVKRGGLFEPAAEPEIKAEEKREEAPTAPAAKAPASEVPAAEAAPALTAEAPAVEVPAAEAASAEAPVPEVPAAEVPATEAAQPLENVALNGQNTVEKDFEALVVVEPEPEETNVEAPRCIFC